MSPTTFDINLLTYISVFGAIWYHYILKFFVPLSFFFCSNFWKIAILKFSENYMKDKFLICTCKKRRYVNVSVTKEDWYSYLLTLIKIRWIASYFEYSLFSLLRSLLYLFIWHYKTPNYLIQTFLKHLEEKLRVIVFSWQGCMEMTIELIQEDICLCFVVVIVAVVLVF